MMNYFCLVKTLVRSLIVCALFCTSISQAANIVVSVLPGVSGCDLIDAIDSANTNTAVGGCTAGAVGQDTITFAPSFARYELDRLVFSSVTEGSSGTPIVVSDIKIVGTTDQLLVIERPTFAAAVRLFTVGIGGNLTLENLSLRGGAQQGGSIEGFLTGGAIRVAGTLTLEQVELANNGAGFGGAIWVQGGDVVIRNSLIRNNTASAQGGGVGMSSNSSVVVFDSTFSGNSAGDYGGGIALAASPNSNLSMYNATISENSAGISGGGISALFEAPEPEQENNTLTIRNTIISGNTASNDNREVHLVNPFISTTDIRNSVLGSSQITFGEATNDTDFLTNNNIVLTSNFDNTPLRSTIGPLADNGGKTLTHALVENSPAIDRGLTFLITGGPIIFFAEPGCSGRFFSLSFELDYRPDQRNVARPLGNECDIGAFEYQPIEQTCYTIKAKNNNVITFCL